MILGKQGDWSMCSGLMMNLLRSMIMENLRTREGEFEQ